MATIASTIQYHHHDRFGVDTVTAAPIAFLTIAVDSNNTINTIITTNMSSKNCSNNSSGHYTRTATTKTATVGGVVISMIMIAIDMARPH